MPNNKINVIRPDGSLTQATEEQFKNLEKLGYKKEEIESEVSRATADQNKADYTTTGERLKTVGEGIISGATLGALDPLITTDQTRHRNEYNPGYRLGGELFGGVGAALLTGGDSLVGQIAERTPAGFLAAQAGRVGEAVGGGIKGLAVAGGIEGGVAGAGQSVTKATMDDSPITLDSVIAGAGWGTIYGAGLGAGIGIAAKGASKLATKSEEAASFVNPIKEDDFSRLRNTTEEFSAQGETINKQHLEAKAGKKAAESRVSELEKEAGTIDKTHANLTKQADKELESSLREFTKDKDVAEKEMNAALREAGDGESGAIIDKYNSKVEEIDGYIKDVKEHHLNTTLGSTTETEARKTANAAERTAVESQLKKATEATERLSIHSNAVKLLESMPKTSEKFVDMGKAQAERMFGAMDALLQKADDGLHPLRQSLSEAAENLVKNTGISVDTSNPVDKLRKVYTVANQSSHEANLAQIQHSIKHGDNTVSWLNRVVKQSAARGASSAAAKAGGGAIGSSLAYQGAAGLAAHMVAGPLGVVAEMSGIRSAVQHRVMNAVAKLSPSTNKVVQHTLPRVEPLLTRMDGTKDKTVYKDKTELATARAREIAEQAGNVREVAFNSVSPLVGEHTEFAAGIHESIAEKFNTLLENIPRDPGTAFNNLKSMWKPNPVQAAQFSKMYQVFHNPLDVIEDFMSDISNIDPIRAKALKDFYPPLYGELRMHIIEKLPELGDLNYHNQARLSNLLDLNLHSSFASTSIASKQAIYMEVPDENKMDSKSPNPSGTSGGRPSKMEPPTPGQSLQRIA